MSKFHAAVIAGTHSGVGKTTWTLALISFLREKGLTIQPFKAGPDYIDTGFHHLICAPRKSRNLDRFLLSADYLRDCFNQNTQETDLALVEGVMGLFDGRSPLSEEGSTAEIAKLLELPVFLVIDGSGLARSAAAMVKGYQAFDASLQLKGVLVNRVGNEVHFNWLKESIEKETGIPVIGWLSNDSSISIPERHLGLRTAAEEEGIQEKIIQMGKLLEGRFDEDRFLEQTTMKWRGAVSAPKKGGETPSLQEKEEKRCRIGIAYDRAFSFYYEDNFDLLRTAGGELVFFSPLSDRMIPEDLDALYFGGGFPEIYGKELSKNETMKVSIRKFHEEGGLIYSECGGLIYLSEAFVDSQGRKFPLAGLLPAEIRMANRLQHFGYHEIKTLIETFLFPEGETLRSHEFHYSVLEMQAKQMSSLLQPFQIQGRTDGFYDGKLLASYQHLHFGQNPTLAERFVRHASLRRNKHAWSQPNL